MSFTVYVASKTLHAPTWRMLRDRGVKVISTWIDEAGTDETKDFADLWRRCIEEASTADFTLAYRREDEVMKGALVEIGAALASGARVMLVGDFTNFGSFMNHQNCIPCSSIEDALETMQKLYDIDEE